MRIIYIPKAGILKQLLFLLLGPQSPAWACELSHTTSESMFSEALPEVFHKLQDLQSWAWEALDSLVAPHGSTRLEGATSQGKGIFSPLHIFPRETELRCRPVR